MSGYKIPSSSLWRVVNSDRPPADCQIEFVTDNVLQLVLNVDARPGRLDSVAWHLALAVEAVADKLDGLDDMTFAAFSLQFAAARMMIEARRLAERKEHASR